MRPMVTAEGNEILGLLTPRVEEAAEDCNDRILIRRGREIEGEMDLRHRSAYLFADLGLLIAEETA